MGGLSSILTPHLVEDRREVERAIYGTVSVIAFIAAAAHDERSAARVLAFAAGSSVVVWAVHVYASVLSVSGPDGVSWREAISQALRHETGVLEGAILPLVVLLLGAVGVIEDQRAILWSMWAGVVMLVLMPTVWLRRAGQPWWRCALASAVGGFFGLVLIGLKVVLH